MKRFLIITLLTTAFASAVLLTLFVKTTTANADIAAGNQAYTAQDYETALQHYTVAQSQAPGQVEPAYNAANTYYRQNVLDKAQQTLEPALAQPQNALAEFVHFNLGNIAYNAQQFDVAIAQYEAALRLQPDDRDAKYNLELALQQQEQQQQQNEEQQNQQDQQQQDQNQQDQQNQDQQNQGQQNQQNQSSNQQNQSGGQQDQQQNQDQQNQDQQQGQQDQQDQQQGQQRDQQQGQQGNQQDKQQGQQGGQPDQQQPDQQNGQAYGARPQQGLTPEQAKRLLAAIGGNSKTLMEKLQLMYMASGGNPDKDW
jgi:tetratricopeptide (TPR) repeat protein